MGHRKKDFLVIGLGRFGTSVARSLVEHGQEVMGVDSDEELVMSLSHELTKTVQADATNEDTLKALGAGNFDVAVVAIGHDVHANTMATLILKEMGVPTVIAKATNPLHQKILHKIGADRVVFPERDMGIRLAHNLISSNIQDFLELAPNYNIMEVKVEKDWVGKSLEEMDFRANYGINVVAIMNGEKMNPAPRAENKIKAGDILIVIGHRDDLERIG